MANRLTELFTRIRIGSKPDPRREIPLPPEKDELVNQLEASDINLHGAFNQFRQVATDRQTMYSAYDEMRSDSVIAAALEMYADDATQTDEQGRIIWVESDSEEITRAGNRLLDVLDIPERAWKQIYQACLYGDSYLKLYREGDEDDSDEDDNQVINKVDRSSQIVNDRKIYKGHNEIPPYDEYIEETDDPSILFDLRRRGVSVGFVEVPKEILSMGGLVSTQSFTFNLADSKFYRPDRFVHIMLGEDLTRTPEEVTIDLGNGKQVTYRSVRGTSILKDVYPIQRMLQLLEDTLLLNRLTRSPLIRLLEVELGDMPKKEVNNYMRRIKNLIEQHIAMDKDNGTYKSFDAPGPIDNVIYIPVRNGKGSVSVNNLGGDVNIRDIADIDYFNNKRAGALKIPKEFLGEDNSGGFDNGGSLVRKSIRYARTIKRIQTAYIRAITTLLNLFFIDKKLDYVNKFTVRMTSPSTQEDLERNELINSKLDLVSNITDLTSSLEGDTQKEVLTYLFSSIMKMPELAEIIKKDSTPDEDIEIEGGGSGGDFSVDLNTNVPDSDEEVETEISNQSNEDNSDLGFTQDEFSEFEDQM